MSMSNTTLTSRNSVTTNDTPVTDAQRQLDGSGAPLFPNPESKALWKDGLPDRDLIKQRMEETLQAYLRTPYPRVNTGRLQWAREIIALKRAQAEFYSEMHYLDDLLYAAPVLPLLAPSTTTVVPYEPAPKRKRGRPSTGGRKPKPTTRKGRRNEEDSD